MADDQEQKPSEHGQGIPRKWEIPPLWEKLNNGIEKRAGIFADPGSFFVYPDDEFLVSPGKKPLIFGRKCYIIMVQVA